MTKVNRRPPFEFRLLSELTHRNRLYVRGESPLAAMQQSPTPKHGAARETRSPWQYVMVMYVWIVYNYSYYGFQFAIIMTQNYMLYFVLMSLSEFFSSYINATVDSVKYMISFAAVCCVLVALLPEGVPATVLLIIAKFMMNFFSGILLSYTMQLFPTHYRAQGFSLCTLASKLALVFMPSTFTWFAQRFRLSPLLIIGLLLATAAGLSFFMMRTEEADTAEITLLEKILY